MAPRTELRVPGIGQVVGKQKRTRGGVPINVFRAIPYAKPPVGKLRFSLPQAFEYGPETTLDFRKKESTKCKQLNPILPSSRIVNWFWNLKTSEDCLYLNVYTPSFPNKENQNGLSMVDLPVLVWFHGGAFCIESNEMSMYGPDYLLDYEVILVGVNYRLGPFGFFNLECEQAPGNQGLHDQVEALKWVQKFIGSFGGSNENITIMGESAGAMSCFLHCVSPLSKGLFHKVVALSGSATTPFLHNDRESTIYARTFAKSFGLNVNDTAQNLVHELQKKSETEIVNKTMLFKDWDNTFHLPWKPVVDKNSKKPFLPLSFEEAIKSGSFDTRIPILAGTMGEEGLILTAPFHKSSKRWKLFFHEWEKWAPQLFFNRETELITENDIVAVNTVFKDYFPDEDALKEDQESLRSTQRLVENDGVLVSNSLIPVVTRSSSKDNCIPPFTDANLKKLEEIMTTSWFHAPLVNDLEKLVTLGANIYTFKFRYQGTFSMVDIFRLPPIKMGINLAGRYIGVKMYRKTLGTCHSDDLVYVFPMKRLPKPLATETDVHISSSLTRYITNFSKFSNPTPITAEDNSIPSFTWPIMNACDNNTVIFTKNGAIVVEPDKDTERNNYWNQLITRNHFSTSNNTIEILHSEIAEFRGRSCCS